MTNTGTTPNQETVDLKFRNGQVIRSTDPKKWRWKPWPWGKSDWDIQTWQEVAWPTSAKR